MANLPGAHVLTIISSRGVEQDEIEQPVEQLRADGASVTIAAPTTEPVQSQVRDWDLGRQIPVDISLGDVSSKDYDMLVIPGGVMNADSLRMDENAQQIAKNFTSEKKPIASLCHGPWLLVETGSIKGKCATSFPSLRVDIINAGGDWQDDELVYCQAQGWTLITSRGPHDLPAFIQALKEELATKA